MCNIKYLKIILIALLLTCAGCATSAPVQTRRFFWPPLPDQPKIEWVGAYWSQHDLPKTGFQKFMENFIGQEEPIRFERPIGIASTGNGKVFVTDPIAAKVFVYDFSANAVRILGGDEGRHLFTEPTGLAIDADDNVYVGDGASKKIYIFDRNEKPLGNIDTAATTKKPVGMAIDQVRRRLYVVDTQGHDVEVFDLKGKHLSTFGKRGSMDGEFNFPASVAVMKNGSIVVTDTMNARVQILDADGKFVTKFGQRGDKPGDFQIIKGVAVDSEDHIYVTDGKGNYIGIFNTNGELLLAVGGTYSAAGKVAPGGFLLPQGIFIDRNDRIYVVDQLNYRFQIFQYINDRYANEHPVAEQK